MRRVVIDTNIYIDWFNAGRHESVLFQRDCVKHLSAIVLMELRAGAFTVRDRRLVQRVEAAAQDSPRLHQTPLSTFADMGSCPPSPSRWGVRASPQFSETPQTLERHSEGRPRLARPLESAAVAAGRPGAVVSQYGNGVMSAERR
jgi:hypothetical protein